MIRFLLLVISLVDFGALFLSVLLDLVELDIDNIVGSDPLIRWDDFIIIINKLIGFNER